MIKNNYLLHHIVALFLLGFSSFSFSAQVCSLPENATPNVAKRYIQCLDSEINKIEQVQATWILKRKFELTKIEEETGNTQVLPLFMRSISNHEKYIKSSCQWRYILKSPNGTAAAISYKLCEIELMKQFTDVLKIPL